MDYDKEKNRVWVTTVGHEGVPTEDIVKKYRAFARLAEVIGNGEYEKRDENLFFIGDDIALSRGDMEDFHLFWRGGAYVISSEDSYDLVCLVEDALAR